MSETVNLWGQERHVMSGLRDQIQAMANKLSRMGYKKAAAATARFLRRLYLSDTADRREFDALQRVWGDVELPEKFEPGGLEAFEYTARFKPGDWVIYKYMEDEAPVVGRVTFALESAPRFGFVYNITRGETFEWSVPEKNMFVSLEDFVAMLPPDAR